MREYSIAAIPADGIGPEVIDAGLAVLNALQQRLGDVRFNVKNFDWGSDYYKRARRDDAGRRADQLKRIRRDLLRRGRRA